MLAPEAADAGSAPISDHSVWSPQYRALTVGLLMIVTAAAFEALAVATILPAISRELGGIELYGWAFSAFLLTRLIGITLAGAEADRQGPAIPFLLGVGLFISGLLIAGFAPSMLVVIAGRAVQGLGSGVIGSVSYVAIARAYPDSMRPRMLALNSTAWVVPGLIGPALAGLIGDYLGWRWVFLGLAPFPLLAVLLAFGAMRGLARAVEQPREWRQARLAVQLALGTTILTIGLGQPLPWAPLVVALGLALGLPALRQLLPAGALLAAAGLPAAVACMGLLSLIFFGVDAFIPLGLNQVRGQAAVVAGLALTAATMTWTAGSWVLDRFARRASRRAFALIGLILIAVGIGLSLLSLWPELPASLAIFAWGIAGLGMGLTYTTLSLVTLELAPSGREGASSAALQVNDTLGSALGTGIGGVIIALYGETGTATALQIQFLLMLGLVLLAILAALRLPGRHTGAVR